MEMINLHLKDSDGEKVKKGVKSKLESESSVAGATGVGHSQSTKNNGTAVISRPDIKVCSLKI